jgi:hypothetical protein
MRWLARLLCVCALGVMPLVGCGEGDACAGVICEDGNECTHDSCSPETGQCVYKPAYEDKSCDDGDNNECTTGECRDGTCESLPTLCLDVSVCTESSCDPDTGCYYTPLPDGTSCCLGWSLACGDSFFCTLYPSFCGPCECIAPAYCHNGECSFGTGGTGGPGGTGGTDGVGGSPG